MANIDPVRLEILKMVKDLVISEHQDRRAQDHNRWLAESDQAWRNQRVRLPYPTIPPYPTEKEIIDRAQEVLEFLSTRNPITVDSISNYKSGTVNTDVAAISNNQDPINDFESALQYLKSQESSNNGST